MLLAQKLNPKRIISYSIALLSLSVTTTYALPNNFVYLDQIAPEIIQEIRYAGNDNFIGEPIPGYNSARCILSQQTAEQLKKIQDKMNQMLLIEREII